MNPSDSAIFLGRPRCAWTEDGTRGIIRQKKEKCPKWQPLGRCSEIIASASFLAHPRCAWAEDGGCGIIRKRQKKFAIWEKLGRNVGIIASVSFRQL